MIIFIAFSFMILLLAWVPMYLKLRKNSQWINSFINLIPISILKSNLHFQAYMKDILHFNNAYK